MFLVLEPTEAQACVCGRGDFGATRANGLVKQEARCQSRVMVINAAARLPAPGEGVAGLWRRSGPLGSARPGLCLHGCGAITASPWPETGR